MSSTRHAKPGSAFAQERYMSSPEYLELRGISGNAVAAKAAILQNAQKRALLFFIQSLSLQPGGLKKLARAVVEMFPHMVGTEGMHRAGISPGKIYSEAEGCEIARELKLYTDDFLFLSSPFASSNSPKERDRSAKFFLEKCHDRINDELEQFLVELCINPKLQLHVPDEDSASLALEREEARIADDTLKERAFTTAHFYCFPEIVSALFAYQKAYEAKVLQSFVKTSISQPVFGTLDFGHQTGKMVVIEGNARLGKTTAAEAWCDAHRGIARFISLSGVAHKTGFFRAIAKALGVTASYAKTSTDMQARVEDVLQRTKLMLVIDEAHYLWPQSERVYSRPELIDWVNTALYNHRVPVGLITTPQFAYRMQNVEKSTGWNSDQFKGRVKRYARLPAAPTKADIAAVARKLLPEGDKDSIDLVVGYALSSKRHMPAVVDVIDEARFQAKANGRSQVIFEDIETAITDYRIPSDSAQASAFEFVEPRRKRIVKRVADAAPIHEPCMGHESDMHSRMDVPASDGVNRVSRIEDTKLLGA